MNEFQRQTALRQMGIQPWFPRYVLPGAAVSTQAEVSAEMFGLEVEAKAPVHPAALFDKGAETSRPQAGRPESRSPARTLKPAPEPPADTGKASPELAGDKSGSDNLRLKVQLVRFSGDLVFMNEMPVAGNGRLTGRHQRLLQQLALVCGVPVEAEPPGIHLFQWPLLDIPGVDNSASAARASLLAFMEEYLHGKTPARLVVMGELLAARVFSHPAELPTSTCFTYNLDQILNLPALKRDVWQVLRKPAASQ